MTNLVVPRVFAGFELLRARGIRGCGSDVAAGIVLAALLVPQGIAYAELSGLPAVSGLHATVVALIAYALLGPSPTLVLGPDSSLAPLIAAAVAPIALGDPDQAVAVGSMLAILTGAISVGLGVARLGTLTELLSGAVRVGFLHGIVVVLVVGQLPKLFGFGVDADSTPTALLEFLRGLLDGDAVGAALAIGAVTVVFVTGLRRRLPRFPGVLVAVVGSILITDVFDLERHGVITTGRLPSGLPLPALPDVEIGDLEQLLLAALAIVVVSLADTSALSSSLSTREGRRVDPNQEIIAVGGASLACGFFGGFPTSVSSSRTAVNQAMGARSQISGLTAAALIIPILLFAGDLLASLPAAALAGIVIAAAPSLVDLESLRRLWRSHPGEWWLSIATSLGVILLGPLEGIGMACILSIAAFVRRSWRPHDAVLVRVEGLKGYHDAARHPEGRRVPGLVLFRFDSPLYFANAEHFRRRVEAVLTDDPSARQLVIVGEPISDVDATAAETLHRVLDDLERRGIDVAFAGLKGPVRDSLVEPGIVDRVGADRFFPTVGTAVSAYVRAADVDWTDWTDRRDGSDDVDR